MCLISMYQLASRVHRVANLQRRVILNNISSTENLNNRCPNLGLSTKLDTKNLLRFRWSLWRHLRPLMGRTNGRQHEVPLSGLQLIGLTAFEAFDKSSADKLPLATRTIRQPGHLSCKLSFRNGHSEIVVLTSPF